MPDGTKNIITIAEVNANSYKLLGILQSHAPDGESQEKATRYYNILVRENSSNPPEIERQMAGALYDGLAYGNWLWNAHV